MIKRKPNTTTTTTEVTPEARSAIAMAFEGVGGVAGLIKWARTSAHARSVFYTQLYSKLIPLTVQGQVNTAVDDDGRRAAEAIELALTKLVLARQERERSDGLVIDAQANPPMPVPIASDRVDAEPDASVSPNTTTSHLATERAERETVRDSTNVVRLRPPDGSASANHPKEPRQPSSTELFYEHGNSSPGWWGPIGSGGKPP
jgi:hypothetical protein